MKEKKFGINWGGLKITTEEEPYVVLGEPLKSEEDAKKLYFKISDKLANYSVMGYTTSIDTIKFIFANKTLRSSSLSNANLNDKMEKQRVGISQFANGRFITCFTHSEHEIIPFWMYYGGKNRERKVQMVFKNFSTSFDNCIYTDYAILPDNKKVFFYSPEYKHTLSTNCTLSEMLGIKPINIEFDIRNCIREISMFDVEYIPENSPELTDDYSSRTNIIIDRNSSTSKKSFNIKSFNPNILGKQKTNPWEYELETRIMLVLDNQEFSEWEYIDIRLKDEIFRDLKIILSPWCSNTHEEEIKKIIHNSSLSEDIKNSISIEHSTLEGTLNL